ncbi:MAG: hypothetical protein K6G81_00420 [Lachnospiraceae bacterium]|nr:hypothetical protein [Lachnospiraceae bacterium]
MDNDKLNSEAVKSANTVGEPASDGKGEAEMSVKTGKSADPAGKEASKAALEETSEAVSDEAAEGTSKAVSEAVGDSTKKKPKKEKKPKSEARIRGEQIAKIVVFLGLFCVILYLLCDIFEYQNDYMRKRYTLYKSFEPDTVDAVFIGTSGVDRSWIAAKGFDKFGISVYPLSTDAMPCWTALDMLKEAYIFQNPRLVLMDMRMFVIYDYSDKVELSKTRARRIIDVLDFFSPNRLDAIKRTRELMHEADPSEEKYDISYFLNFILYHSQWSEDDFEPFSEIGCPASKHLGYYLTKKDVKITKLKQSEWTDEREKLTDIALESLEEILEYCGEHDIELLFVDTPHRLNENEMMRTNELCDILDEKGIKWIRYSDKIYYNEGNLDKYIVWNEEKSVYSVDFNGMYWEFETFDEAFEYMQLHTVSRDEHFYDESHLNFDGAVIFTRLLGDYLVTNYGLTDHKDDPKYEDWIPVYNKIKKKIKKYRLAVQPEEGEELTEEDLLEMQQEEKELKAEEELDKQVNEVREKEDRTD